MAKSKKIGTPGEIPVKVQWVPIGDIKPNPQNPRKISEEQISKLSKSISDFPEMVKYRFLVVDRETGNILGGNQRWLSMKRLGWEEVPVAYSDEMTEEQQKEFIIRDNIDVGEWDEEILDERFRDFPLVDWGLLETAPEAEKREQDTSSVAAAKEVYDNAEVRQVVVYFDAETHARVTEQLEQIKEKNYFGDNAEVLLFLIENYG